jgi:hypothetical protein
VRQDGAEVIISVPEPDLAVWQETETRFRGRLRMVLSTAPYLRFRIEKKAQALEDLIALFTAYGQIAHSKKTVDKP